MASTSESAPVKTVQLEGKIIAITGANRGMRNLSNSHYTTKPTDNDPGIGLGIADCCLTNGAKAIYSIDIGDIGDEFAELSKKFPNQLFALQADVTKEDSIQTAIDKILEQAGGLHGMVCNAGRTKHKAALDFTTEEIDQLLGVNLYGSFYSARCAARAFIKQGVKGSIVFTASMASYRPNKVNRSSFTPIQHVSLTVSPARTVSPLRGLQSRCPEHDTHARYGVGAIQHTCKFRFSGPCQDSDDILGAAAA